MSARPNAKARQWRRPRKSHDSDMLLVRNGPQLKRGNTGGALADTKGLVGLRQVEGLQWGNSKHALDVNVARANEPEGIRVCPLRRSCSRPLR